MTWLHVEVARDRPCEECGATVRRGEACWLADDGPTRVRVRHDTPRCEPVVVVEDDGATD